MPIVFSFDLANYDTKRSDHQRIVSAFGRFGWQHIGGSAFRYPPLGLQGKDPQPKDWFNRVIPALMLSRAFIRRTGVTLTRCTLEAHSSTGYESKPGSEDGDYGKLPADAEAVLLDGREYHYFGRRQLGNWLNGVADL
ncbi:MAG TPA: hypothetical protein VMS17_28165 [Gemmataceae bacterium]|nr:hypothetical protein [Gemmataceae bacterium]